jgi:predicted NBD/HSP70 family sugar kinase
MADQTLAKFVNELGILTQLRTTGSASRADLARRLALTPATVTRLVASLQQAGLVRELPDLPGAGKVREPGRPGVTIAINPDGAYFLGVEIGVGILRLALIDLSTATVEAVERTVPRDLAPEATIAIVAAEIAKIRGNPRYANRIRSVGVTVPGLVRSDGYVIYLPILGWRDLDLAPLLAESVGLNCVVENNANAAAFGAVYTEPAIPSVSTVFLKLGTGCGGAVIVNGRLLRGAAGTAAEFGHIRLTPHGHRCSCGQIGCLETWVNLAAMARAFLGTDASSEAAYAALPSQIVKAAGTGDPAALAAAGSFAEHLGLGIVTLVNIFNPTTIVLGGVMRPLIDFVLPQLEAIVTGGIVPGTLVPELRLSALGVFECAIGAATLAHHAAFDLSRLELTDAETAN